MEKYEVSLFAYCVERYFAYYAIKNCEAEMNIQEILEKHKLWLDGHKDGEQADLMGADLYSADLSGADLMGAYLRCADLGGADLYGANLYCVDLRGVDLRGAKYIIQWQSPLGIKRTCYSVKHEDCVMHKLGCFWGNTQEAVYAIREKYGEGSCYEKLLVLNAQALEEHT